MQALAFWILLCRKTLPVTAAKPSRLMRVVTTRTSTRCIHLNQTPPHPGMSQNIPRSSEHARMHHDVGRWALSQTQLALSNRLSLPQAIFIRSRQRLLWCQKCRCSHNEPALHECSAVMPALRASNACTSLLWRLSIHTIAARLCCS